MNSRKMNKENRKTGLKRLIRRLNTKEKQFIAETMKIMIDHNKRHK